MSARPFALDFQPGIQRDGTQFDSKRYLDAQWCRWRLGRPRKMGGYRRITDGVLGLPRKAHMFYAGSRIYIHVGSVNGIQQFIIDPNGNLISSANRTPLMFAAGANIGFTMDAIFDTTSKVTQLIVHSVPDDGNLSSPISEVPFIGDITSASRLTLFGSPGTLSPGAVWTQPNISGGIVCIQPYVFDFDSNGKIGWSAPNRPLTLGVVGGNEGAGEARVSAQKIVQGFPIKGGGAQSPAGVFWSLSEVITASFIGGLAAFKFTTASSSSSILSSDGVIEYDGLHFWAGVDRFLVFNGTVTELPNPQNQDWFFNNLTPGYESQTFAMKIPRYGEIWWGACMFGSTVPNHAIIFNLRENCWYDTALPDGCRSMGHTPQGFRYPIMGGYDPNGNGRPYKLWMHEYGVDKDDGGILSPIRSFFETAWFGGPKDDPPDDRGLSVQQLEPDFVQTGDLSVHLIGAANTRSPENAGPDVPLLQVPGVPQEEFVSFTPTQAQRLTRLHVESNVLGGDYKTGRNLMRGDPSEKRVNS